MSELAAALLELLIIVATEVERYWREARGRRDDAGA